MGAFDYQRRTTCPVTVGNVVIGGDSPIRLQSMTSTSTMDTDGSVEQCEAIRKAGADIVRLTAQGIREADNLGKIRARLRGMGSGIPLVADIHFNPKAAFAAARQVEKVRINPGNFVDPGRTFRKIEFTDEEYSREIDRIGETLIPFLNLCRENHTAIRIGVNHGSLSDRIMSRYGDTPAGMVESAMEFLRICVSENFMDVVISIKASNVSLMVETVRRLVRAMDAEDMHFPLHLGVTEAGDGEDGRVKSAVGIGALLAEGVGDTIRVSLSEAPEKEVPVAKALADYIQSRAHAPAIKGERWEGYDPVSPSRRSTRPIGIVGGQCQPVVVGSDPLAEYDSDNHPDFFPDTLADHVELDAGDFLAGRVDIPHEKIVVLTSSHPNYTGEMQAALHAMMQRGIDNPVILKASYRGVAPDETVIRAAADLGTLLINGFRDGIWLDAPALSPGEAAHLSFTILQSARLRITRTEYIACPGCGRTLFDLRNTLSRIKDSTSALKGLKIGVMGCIVNGPGEMADADYGYVGAGIGKVSLYKGKECVEKNIPAEEAVEHLINLIKREGDWK